MADEPQDAQGQVDQSASSRFNDDQQMTTYSCEKLLGNIVREKGTLRDNGEVYEGELKDGKPHGKGVCRDASGTAYDGEWKDGTPHGAGIMTYADGAVYDGEMMRGKRQGTGTLTWTNGNVYDGEWKEGKRHGKGVLTWANSDVYYGEWKDDKKHGWGTLTWEDGDAYDGEWKEDKRHGTGTFTWTSGIVYCGEFDGNKKQGKGTFTWENGDIYEGEFNDGLLHGAGTYTYANGDVHNGQWVGGKRHGKGALKQTNGNMYVGQWAGGREHGRGAFKWNNGDVFAGDWADGKKTRGTMKWASGDSQTVRFPPDCNDRGVSLITSTGALVAAPSVREIPNVRKMRSQRSQQRRLQSTKKCCEQCGASDDTCKLRVCSGCNLALYCSVACQKAARGSHQRICNISSQLPSKGAYSLALRYNRDKMVDLDAGLRYGTKYMSNLKHLKINIKAIASGDAIKLSTKYLSSLLKSKKGTIESVFWLATDALDEVHGTIETNVWKELRGLKNLRLEHIRFDGAQPVCGIIGQQEDTLMALTLSHLQIDWSRAKSRKSIAMAVSSCKHLVKLELPGCVLMDSDLKVMLPDLLNLRDLVLKRDTKHSYEFTDNSCGLIARKCPGLQELCLTYHDQLSMKGIRKIFEGCPHLRSFYTTTRKLNCKNVRSLLDIAPRLLYLYLGVQTGLPKAEMSQIIEAMGGRTVLELNGEVFMPDSVSAKTREMYECQRGVLNDVWSQETDPEVANMWAGMFEG